MTGKRLARRLVLCTQAVEGGAWMRLVELLTGLESRGWRSDLVTWDEPQVRALGDRLAGVTVHPLDVPPAGRNLLRLAWASGGVLGALAPARTGSDGIVWGGSFAGASGLGMTRWRRAAESRRMFSFLRGVELERSRTRAAGRGRWLRWSREVVHRRAMASMLSASDLLLTQTPGAASSLLDEYGGRVPARRAVLPNNVDAAWIEARRAEVELRGPVELPGRRAALEIAFVGRLQWRVKGLDTLLEAAERLRDADVRFHLAGDGEDAGRVRESVEAAGLGESVRLLGPMENPLRLMAAADLVVAPSRSEGVPNVVLEALAVGRPVLGSDIEGIRSLLAGDDLLVPPGDAEALARRIRRLVGETALLAQWTERCRSRAEALRFDWAGRFVEILEANS